MFLLLAFVTVVISWNYFDPHLDTEWLGSHTLLLEDSRTMSTPFGNKSPTELFKAAIPFENVMESVAMLHYNAIQGNHSESNLILGLLYAYGIGVRTSDSESLKYFQKASELSNIDATLILAHRNTGNCSQQLAYARKAAATVVSQLWAPSMPPRSNSILHHLTRNQSSSQWWHFLMKEAQRGTTEALSILGLSFMTGAGGEVFQDASLALHYLERALAKGEVGAYGLLGALYYRGLPESSPPLPRNLQKARWYFEEGTKQGSSVAMNGLGYLHATGEISQHFNKEKTALIASGDDHHSAVDDGRFDPSFQSNRSWRKAFHLFTEAANAGNVDGAYNLALLHLHGRTPNRIRSPERSRLMFEEMAKDGHIPSKFQLIQMAQGLLNSSLSCRTLVNAYTDVTIHSPILVQRELEAKKLEKEKGKQIPALLHWFLLTEETNGQTGGNDAFENAQRLLQKMLRRRSAFKVYRQSLEPSTVQQSEFDSVSFFTDPHRTESKTYRKALERLHSTFPKMNQLCESTRSFLNDPLRHDAPLWLRLEQTPEVLKHVANPLEIQPNYQPWITRIRQTLLWWSRETLLNVTTIESWLVWAARRQLVLQQISSVDRPSSSSQQRGENQRVNTKVLQRLYKLEPTGIARVCALQLALSQNSSRALVQFVWDSAWILGRGPPSENWLQQFSSKGDENHSVASVQKTLWIVWKLCRLVSVTVRIWAKFSESWHRVNWLWILQLCLFLLCWIKRSSNSSTSVAGGSLKWKGRIHLRRWRKTKK